MLLSGKAQTLYDHLVDLKEEMKSAREKRQNALMGNDRYAALKEQAAKIVKEAAAIVKSFDAKNPKFKNDIEAIQHEARKTGEGLSMIAIKAAVEGINLEVYRGRGKSKKRVKFTLIAQPGLFDK